MARVELPDEHKAAVLKRYTYFKKGGHDPPVISYRYKAGTAYLPINMQKLQEVASLLGANLIDERGLRNIPPTESFHLSQGFAFRDFQREPAASLLKYIQQHKYGTFAAPCGSGKTIMLAYVAGMLQERTLVLIDQSNLVPNWVDAFQILWGLEAQVITSKTTELPQVGIVTFQLLNRNDDLLYRIKNEYGCLLIDEAHTVTADTYCKVLFQMSNKYRIATSATFFNKHLPTELLEDCCGAPVCVTMTDPNALIPEVDFISTMVDTPTDSPDTFANKTLPYLASSDKRNTLIIDLVREGIANDRHIVVICITQDMANYLADKASEFCVAEAYVGTSSRKKDLDIKTRFESGELRCVFTCKKLDKGTDFTIADMLINARPGNNEASTQQLSGRVVRKKEGKPTPIILDLVDRGRLVWRFAANRYKWYTKFNYKFSKSEYFFLDMF